MCGEMKSFGGLDLGVLFSLLLQTFRTEVECKR